jgi:hypothetical protein
MSPLVAVLFVPLALVGFAKGFGIRWVRWSFAAPLLVGVLLAAAASRPAPAPTHSTTLTPTLTATVEVVP